MANGTGTKCNPALLVLNQSLFHNLLAQRIEYFVKVPKIMEIIEIHDF